MKQRLITSLMCIAVLLFVLLTVSNGSPSGADPARNTENTAAEQPVVSTELLENKAAAYNDFALQMLAFLQNEENTLFSPLSTLQGLSMTANGADGNTLTQFENAFGMSAQEMKTYLHSQNSILSQKTNILKTANSLWISSGNNFKVSDGYIDTCTLWYDAEVFRTEFNDKALSEMGEWVTENAEGAMVSPISRFRSTDGIILLNTMLFDAYWETPFNENANYDGTFTREDGREDLCTYMTSTEEIYFKNDYCTGFIKNYVSSDYKFAAILPAEGTTIETLLSTLNGHSLYNLLSSGASANVHVIVPKFTAGTSSDLITPLMEMGVTDVFDYELADLSGIGDEQLAVTDILQNASFTIDEIGTRAAAVSTVAEYPASVREPAEEQWVNLDRPFVYLILESSNFTPIFIGTFMTAE